MKEDSKFIRHLPCPKCGSHDALSVYSDGHAYCFSCQSYFKNLGDNMTNTSYEKPDSEFLSGDYMPLIARGITKETCEKFGYLCGEYNGKPVQIANYYTPNGKLSGQKLRFKDKGFCVKGKVSDILFGSQLWSAGRKIVITEGEIDCLTVSQLQGNKWPVVSIPNGAPSAKRVLEANLEYLNGFDEIILMFDMDEAGRKAIEESAPVLPIGKAFIANLPMKDPNECLVNGKGNEVIQAIWNAKPYRPDGIVSGTDLYEKCVTDINDLKDSVMYPFEALNNKTKGARHGELYVITSGSGMGKSTLLRELEFFFGQHETCGIVALEESNRTTGLELMSLYCNKRLRLYPDSATESERSDAFKHTIGNGRYYLYDHFGSLDSGNLLSKLRYLIVGLGCKRIFLDHISIVVSGMDNDDDGGERKAIDKLMTNLRSLVEETGCTMFVVSHLKRPEGKGHEEGGKVSLSQLRGSGSIAQLADMVIGLERNQQGATPNIMTVRLLKNRFSGDVGISGYLEYDPDTGRLHDFNLNEGEKADDFGF